MWSVHYKQLEKEQVNLDQTCTQAKMLTAFPLTTARDRPWWSHWRSLGSPDASTSFFVTKTTQKRGSGLAIFLPPRYWRQQISWSYIVPPPVKHSVLWHDTTWIKRSVCHALSMMLLVAAMLHLHVWYAIAFQFDSHLGDSPPLSCWVWVTI